MPDPVAAIVVTFFVGGIIGLALGHTLGRFDGREERDEIEREAKILRAAARPFGAELAGVRSGHSGEVRAAS